MRLINEIASRTFGLWFPPPLWTVSEWADEKRMLSSEASAESGRWQTDRAPYQRGMLDAVNDDDVEQVTVMSSAQIGKTELLLNTIGYYIDYDPAPLMLLQPTIDMAQAFSKDRLAPMIRDTTAITNKVHGGKSETLLHKGFVGGHITLAGSNSPASLASRPIRILLADEIDRYPLSAGSEGDPFNLAKKRTTTFHNKKIFAVSTPTIKGMSRIEEMFEQSDKRRYHLKCPECGHKQPLNWEQITFEPIGHSCRDCGVVSKEWDWKGQIGEWIPERPEIKHHRGFHLNELVSPWRKWADVINDFKEAKDNPETLKTWVNTSLGETWDDSEGETIDGSILYARRENYAADVPQRGLFLVAGVDVQDDRIEGEIIAYGAGEESFGIEYFRLYGDPSRPELWNQVEKQLNKNYRHESGVTMPISRICIDSGGHYTDEVYEFSKRMGITRVIPIKGASTMGKPIITFPKKKTDRGVYLTIVGTDNAKDLTYQRFSITTDDITSRNDGFCHFPIRDDYSMSYFDMATAESKVVKYSKGQRRFEWHCPSGKRNEALDCRVYALAALRISQQKFGLRLDEVEVNAEPRARRRKKTKRLI